MKKNPRLPRRVWYGPDKLKAAFLAGQGKSAYEIAHIIGGTTPQRVRAMLAAHDIALLSGVGRDILQLNWRTTDRERLDRIAQRLDRPAQELAGLIVRKVLIERPELIDEIDDLDVL